MGLRRLKMATLRCALIFLGCPEEESTPVLVLDTDSQHPHKGRHTFPMSLWRTTMSKHSACPVSRAQRNVQRETAGGSSL